MLDDATAAGQLLEQGGYLAHALQHAAGGRELSVRSEATRPDRAAHPRGDRRLEEFARDFATRHALPPLERIYVAKLLFALTTLADEGAFEPGSTVTAVVTGPR